MTSNERLRPPSFRSLRPSSAAASAFGRGNRQRNTEPELLFRSALRRLGLRYRTCDARLPGRPDVVFSRHKVAIYVDGDFWHGRNWKERKAKLARGANATYWVSKIERNRVRDRIVGRELRKLGWRVARVWESDVRRDPEAVALRVVRRLGLTTEMQASAPSHLEKR